MTGHLTEPVIRHTPRRVLHGRRGHIAVRIDQVVRALDGSVLGTGVYDHVHQVTDGRIVRMDIYPTAGARLGQ